MLGYGHLACWDTQSALTQFALTQFALVIGTSHMIETVLAIQSVKPASALKKS